jgi:hypothetical protein
MMTVAELVQLLRKLPQEARLEFVAGQAFTLADNGRDTVTVQVPAQAPKAK